MKYLLCKILNNIIKFILNPKLIQFDSGEYAIILGYGFHMYYSMRDDDWYSDSYYVKNYCLTNDEEKAKKRYATFLKTYSFKTTPSYKVIS